MGVVSILLLAHQASSADVVDNGEDCHKIKIEIGDMAAQQQDNSGSPSKSTSYAQAF